MHGRPAGASTRHRMCLLPAAQVPHLTADYGLLGDSGSWYERLYEECAVARRPLMPRFNSRLTQVRTQVLNTQCGILGRVGDIVC